MDSNIREQLALKGFEDTLNRHGYGFQHAVLKKVADMRTSTPQLSAFSVEVAEFPVEADKNTKIDFIAQRIAPLPYPGNHGVCPRMFLLAECKRVNPALSNWCFIRAPFTRRTGYANSLTLEVGRVDSKYVLAMQHIHCPTNLNLSFHLGLPIKSDQKGDSCSDSGRDAIEDAATQSMRGLNGFVNFIKRAPGVIGPDNSFVLLPVIFTTAKLWTSDDDLSKADIESGNLDILKHGSLQSREWLFFEYNQSPTLKHSVEYTEHPADLSEWLQQDFIRTIVIVSVKGIEGFMTWISHQPLSWLK
jgi:hypothetical protein